MSDEVQGAEAPQGTETTPAPAAATPVETALAGPWAKDIQAVFTDPEVARQVDAFLGQKVQPYVTTKEQEVAALKNAKEMYESFETNPGDAFLDLAEELFGAEARAAVLSQLEELYGEGTEETPAPAAEGTPTDPNAEWLANFRQQQEEAQALAEYNAAVEALKADNPHIDEELFAPFVVTAEGDLDTALAAYNAFAKKSGLLKEEPLAEQVPAPAVIGGEGAAAPVVSKTYGSLDEALDDAMADWRPAAPPTA